MTGAPATMTLMGLGVIGSSHPKFTWYAWDAWNV